MNLEEYNYWNDHRVQAGMMLVGSHLRISTRTLTSLTEVDRENNPNEMVERYDSHLQFEAEYAAEVAAERRMGA